MRSGIHDKLRVFLQEMQDNDYGIPLELDIDKECKLYTRRELTLTWCMNRTENYSEWFIFPDLNETLRLPETTLVLSAGYSPDGRLLATCHRESYLGGYGTEKIWNVDPATHAVGECLRVFTMKTNSRGMQVSGTRGLEKIGQQSSDEYTGTLLEFFADRGAVLDEEQQKLLIELRKQRETRQEAPQERKPAEKPHRKNRRK